jgi:hypothetical protein
VTGAGVISVRVGNYGALDRLYRVDVEGTGLAAHAAARRHHDVFGLHGAEIVIPKSSRRAGYAVKSAWPI